MFKEVFQYYCIRYYFNLTWVQIWRIFVGVRISAYEMYHP